MPCRKGLRVHIMSVTNFNHSRQMGRRSFDKKLRLSVSKTKKDMTSSPQDDILIWLTAMVPKWYPIFIILGEDDQQDWCVYECTGSDPLFRFFYCCLAPGNSIRRILHVFRRSSSGNDQCSRNAE